MAGDAFEETLAGFRRWAGTTERKLSGDPEEDAAELYTVFSLMPNYLGIDAPSRLTAGSLNELLLHVYPRKVTVLDRNDIASTIPALRDPTSYLADTGAVTEGTARAMDRELDEIEPDFADAVMDPFNWGPATALMHAMHRDGVDSRRIRSGWRSSRARGRPGTGTTITSAGGCTRPAVGSLP
jgi:hypothetical protein